MRLLIGSDFLPARIKTEIWVSEKTEVRALGGYDVHAPPDPTRWFRQQRAPRRRPRTPGFSKKLASASETGGFQRPKGSVRTFRNSPLHWRANVKVCQVALVGHGPSVALDVQPDDVLLRLAAVQSSTQCLVHIHGGPLVPIDPVFAGTRGVKILLRRCRP